MLLEVVAVFCRRLFRRKLLVRNDLEFFCVHLGPPAAGQKTTRLFSPKSVPLDGCDCRDRRREPKLKVI